MKMTEIEIVHSILNQLYEVNSEVDFKAIRRAIKKFIKLGYLSQGKGRELLVSVHQREMNYIDAVRNSLEREEE